MSLLKNLRLKAGYTQEALAKELGVSKQTLIAYEKNSGSIPAGRVAQLADILGVDCDSIIRNTEPKSYRYEVENSLPQSLNEEVPAIYGKYRISIPQENIEKFKEVFLYILSRVGACPNVGQTVLYKLLYFIDFDYYEKFEEQLMGARYIKNTFGPTPVDFAKITQEMERANELSVVKDQYFTKEQTKYLPRREANLGLFSARDLAHIDACLRKYAWMNAREISDYSHKDVPWIVATEREPIAYESVFYRTPETSVRRYDDE